MSCTAFLHPLPLNTIPATRTKLIFSPHPSPRHPQPARATLPAPPKAPPARRVKTVDVFNNPPPRSTARRAPPQPVLIVPGFGAVATEYIPLRDALRAQLGPDAFVEVVPITATTWFSCLGGRPVTGVINLIDQSVDRARRLTGSSKVSIVAHSAAGWISRIYLGHIPYPAGGNVWQGNQVVSTLLCLGTPHRSDEPITKNNMAFVNSAYPGAFHSHVDYFNFAGDGASIASGSGTKWWAFWRSGWFHRITYRLTDSAIADGPVIGDGKSLLPHKYSCLCLPQCLTQSILSLVFPIQQASFRCPSHF